MLDVVYMLTDTGFSLSLMCCCCCCCCLKRNFDIIPT